MAQLPNIAGLTPCSAVYTLIAALWHIHTTDNLYSVIGVNFWRDFDALTANCDQPLSEDYLEVLAILKGYRAS